MTPTTTEPTLALPFLRSPAALKRIALGTVVAAAAGLTYGLLAPKWYRTVITVVPTKAQKTGLAGLAGGDLAGLASAFDSSSGGADVQRIAAVLQSVAVTDAVIDKFDLRTRYHEEYQEDAREKLWKHCEVKALPKPGLVELSCEDRDPRFLQTMLAFFADFGNRIFRHVGVSTASEQVLYLEKRTTELRQQADESAARMQDFQETHHIVDLDTQAKAVVSTMATLQSQRISKQLELDYARTFSSGDEATLRQLQSQLSVVTNKLQTLEEPGITPVAGDKVGSGTPPSRGLFPAALSVPKLRAEFEKLFRDRKVAETTLVFSLEHLEAARADEARDTSTFLILDPPTVATLPSRPKRLVAFLLFTLVGLALAVVAEWARSQGGAGQLVALLWKSGGPVDGSSRAA